MVAGDFHQNLQSPSAAGLLCSQQVQAPVVIACAFLPLQHHLRLECQQQVANPVLYVPCRCDSSVGRPSEPSRDCSDGLSRAQTQERCLEP